MGAPKQKWTPGEEAALKAGVIKHGTGKWRTILSDPDYTSILKSRSNVDLKDKWRNISVTALWGSRKKAKLALKRTPSSSVHNQDDNNSRALAIVSLSNGGENVGQHIVPTSPPVGSCEPSPVAYKGPFTSVDKIILETITNLKKPFGPDGKSILLYIEENFKMQPDMKRLVTSRLKYLTNVGTLVKIKHRYRISPNYMTAGANQSSHQLLLEGNKENSPNPTENGVGYLTNSLVDGEVLMIEGLTAREAADAASRAVAEAEFAIAEAEESAREADEAEAEAEAAQIFAKAAMKALKYMMHSQTR